MNTRQLLSWDNGKGTQQGSSRETLAAADLIPGDVILRTGDEVVGYPYAGALGRTMLPVETKRGIAITHLVESETPFEVIR